MTRTAVCFSGQARAINYTYLNLKNSLIDPLNCDVFIYCAEDEDSHKYRPCLDYLEPKLIQVEKDIPIDTTGINHQIRHGNVEVYLQMLVSWKKANNLRLEYEKKNKFVYDRIIKTRLDIKLFEPLLNIDDYDIDNFIYVPDFHSFACVQGAGTNDRFVIGNSNHITAYSNMIDYIKQYISEGHILHSESTLHYHLRKQNLKRKLVPIRFTRVRQYGEEIDNRLREDLSKWNPIEKGYYGE